MAKLSSYIFFYYFPLLLILLLWISCSKKEEVNVNNEIPLIENTEEVTDTLYALLNEESTLEDYWEVFKIDAVRSGRLDPSLNKTISLFFGNEPDFASGVTADHAGRAYSICNDDVVSFEIIESFWEDYTIVQRLYVFYHEAGHARYNYRHPCEINEVCNVNTFDLPIMWRAAFAGNNNNFEEFIKDKKDFFARRWDGVRYFNCSSTK